MDIRLLGSLEVVAGDGTAITVRGARLRALLVALAMRAGEPVPTDVLVETLWGDAVPERVANALQRQVSTLRRVLGSPSVVEHRDNGYALRIGRDRVDVFRFEDLVQRGRDAVRAGDFALASDVLAEAIACWRGDAIGGMPYDAWLHTDTVRLSELRVAAVEMHVDAQLALGRHRETVGTLEQLVAEHPLRERFRAQLMVSLARSGRQADALREYEAARHVLAEELGVDPSPELRSLELAILRQEPGVVEAAVDATPARTRSRLPAALTPLVGRQGDIDRLRDLLRDARLVTLVGPGGAGKTRLANETVRRLAHEGVDVSLVELGEVTGERDVVPAILTALELERGAGQGADLTRLTEYLCGRQALLVLDNCEHLVGAVAATVQQLLESCEQLTVLATSREGLCVPGETLSAVPPLPIDDAVALFRGRARAVVPPGAAPDALDDDAVVRDICARLDGLPLAIELAAARLRSMPLAELAAGLDDRFRLLDRGARTARPRQQTLRAVVDWSYDLLFEDERHVFERLSVFAGGCTLDAARAVCAGAGVTRDDVTDLLTRLAEKSLVALSHDPERGTRCTMLQTLAAYGRDRLVQSAGAEDAYDAHLAYFVDVARHSNAALRGERQRHWMVTVAAEMENLRMAFAHACSTGNADAATSIAGSLGWYWWFTGRVVEGQQWMQHARACAGADRTPAWGLVLGWSAFLCAPGFVLWSETNDAQPGEVGTANECDLVRWEEQAAAALAAAGATADLSMLDTAIAVAYTTRGDYDRAAAILGESERLLATLPSRPWVDAMRRYVAGRRAFAGDAHDEATAAFSASAPLLEAIGGEVHSAFASRYLGRLAALRGDAGTSIGHVLTAMRVANTLDMRGFTSALVMDLAASLSANGDHAAARRALERSLAAARDVRSRRGTGESLTALALVEWHAGNGDRAALRAREGLEAARAADHREAVAHCLAVLGYVAEANGDVDGALVHHGEVLDIARKDGDRRLLALAVDGFAAVAVAQCDDVTAARRFGAAHALRSSPGRCAGWAFAVVPRADRDRLLDGVRERSGDEVVSAAFASGASDPSPVVAAITAPPVS